MHKTAENNDSVVLLLKSGDLTALFTGDLELGLSRNRVHKRFEGLASRKQGGADAREI